MFPQLFPGLRVVPRSLSPSCVTREKTTRKMHAAMFSSRFIYSLARRTKRKGTTRSLLVPVLLNFPKFFYNQTEAKKFIVSIRKQCYSKTEITCLFLSSI